KVPKPTRVTLSPLARAPVTVWMKADNVLVTSDFGCPVAFATFSTSSARFIRFPPCWEMLIPTHRRDDIRGVSNRQGILTAIQKNLFRASRANCDGVKVPASQAFRFLLNLRWRRFFSASQKKHCAENALTIQFAAMGHSMDIPQMLIVGGFQQERVFFA